MEAKDLIEKYNTVGLNAEEVRRMEDLLASGAIDLDELNVINEFNHKLDGLEIPGPSERMSDGFYAMLAQEKKQSKAAGSFDLVRWFTVKPAFRWAYSFGLVLVGVLGGYLVSRQPADNQQLDQLTSEVADMKEMMMLTLIDKESTSDRLKAVNLTSEMTNVSQKVTDALLNTLVKDDNVNVRLAAIDALYPYASNPEVRKGIIRSIVKQESPMVQVALAEMMVGLQVKGSVKELENLAGKETTPPEVKEKLKESIDILI